MSRCKHILAMLTVAVLLVALRHFCRQNPPVPQPPVFPTDREGVVVGPLTALNNGRWIRSFRAADGSLYLHGKRQSRDGGRTVEPETALDVEDITAAPERAALARIVGSGSTLVEVEPDALFLQVDHWIGRVTLRPREAMAHR